MANGNKNQWIIWTMVIGAVIGTLIAFNYQGGRNETVPLSEIFPDENERAGNVEYEFVEDEQVAPVEVTSQAPAVALAQKKQVTQTQNLPSPQPTNVNVARAGNYAIQVLASKNKSATEKALEKAKAKGYSAYISTKDMGEKGVWYRIYIGNFETKKQAEEQLAAAKKDYPDSFVLLLKNN